MNKRVARHKRGLRTKAVLHKSNAPRLVVFRSSKHIYGQIVERGEKGDVVLTSASTMDKEIKFSGDKSAQASLVGATLAKRAKELKLESICFDRSGYKYHGRIMALANGAREAGLIF